MPTQWVQNLIDFHEAGELPARLDNPYLPFNDRRSLRRKILREEICEYFDAEDNNDLVGIADGLIDIIYVAIGTCLEYGIDPDAVMAEIQRSNMSKCVDGKILRRSDGKIMKPEGYTPPDIHSVLYSI